LEEQRKKSEPSPLLKGGGTREPACISVRSHSPA